MSKLPLVALAVLFACAQPQPSEPYVVRFSADTLDTYVLEGRFLTASDSLAQPTLMEISDEYVLVGDRLASRAIMVFDRHTGEFLAHMGAEGEAPGEVGSLWDMDVKPNHRTAWLYDYRARALSSIDPEAQTIVPYRIPLSGAGTPLSAVWIKGDSILSSGMHESGRLAIHGPSGDFRRFIGPAPPGDETVPIPVRQHAFEAKLRTNSDGSRIVVAAENADLLEIFDTKGILHTIRGPGFHDPIYQTDGDDEGNAWLIMDSQTIQGYVDAAVTDWRIFGLYSGRSRAWVRGNRWYSPPGRRVVVFTWEALPTAVLEIEDGAIAIGVSDDGRDLYAIYHRPTPMILHYELPLSISDGNLHKPAPRAM